MLTNHEIISLLNGLIETCRDGQEGFRMAADGVTENSLRQILLDFSFQRSQFALNLQELAQGIAPDPETNETETVGLLRGWINIKAAVAREDEANILEECAFGEDAAVNNYRDALEKTLPDPILDVVRAQYEQVREGRDRIRELTIATAPHTIPGGSGPESPVTGEEIEKNAVPVTTLS
jgi:uncharacterized protein (TIGR02284 family)